MMRKNVAIGAGMSILLVIAIAVYIATDHRTPYGRRDDVVVSQAAKTLLYLPLYIADRRGYFEDEGIDVTIITSGGDSQAFAAVVGGSAQFGQGDPMMVPIARQRGGPGKIVGLVVARVAFWGVAISESVEPIGKAEDFKGKKVVTYPKPMTIFALQKKNALEGGLKLGADTSIVEAQFGTELAPLFAGDADITMTIEPVVSQALARGAKIVYSFPEKHGEFALTGIMVDEELVTSNPELVQRTLNAYQRALTHAYEDPDDAIAVAAEEFPDVDKTILENAVRRMIEEETLPRQLIVSEEAYARAHDLRREIGDLEKPVPFGEAVDNRFAEGAWREFGPGVR